MPSSRRPAQRRLLRPATVVGGLLLLLVVLALLALPFRSAPASAEDAKADLEAARDALTAGDLDAARASVDSARAHTDDLQGAMQGIGGDVWSLVPVVGAPVSDVRHLGNALDRLTATAELAVEAWPTVNGKNATLLRGGSVDVDSLRVLVDAVSSASANLDVAQTELGEVHDSALGVGTRLAEARDEAEDVVTPLATTARRTKPLTDALPDLFGASGRRSYLLALLNPSEQRFSGGAPLTLAPITVEDGRLEVGEARDTTDRDLYKVGRWERVDGNPFHTGKLRISTATYAPDWSVSGEELLRGWERRGGAPQDGLVAVDVVALADLLRITGPVEVPVYGTIDSTNFTQKLVGDYDAYPSNAARHDLNLALVPVFSDRLFSPGQGRQKIESLRDSARGRHFALWMRDPDVQAAVTDVGLSGELSDTDHDYIAVLNQNTNASKADYWQHRSVATDVRLREDGSAKVRMTITVRNDSPPYTAPFGDPRAGTSLTRWNGMTLGVFLPEGVEVGAATVAGTSVGTDVFDYYGRPYKLLRLTLPPTESRTAELEYVVPEAATAGDGELAYHLDATPQGMVVPQAVSVTVHWPAGYDVTDLPEGWTRSAAGVATWDDPGLVTQPSFTVVGSSAQ